MGRPDVAQVLGSLKDFQRDTVHYAFDRLWGDEDPTRRFLVADEVGLGKTMVAKGVIARAVDHLWDKQDRINVVYICSNNQIARQNLARLNAVGGHEVRHADRLTLLPGALNDLRGGKVNFVSFTPGTSFSVGHQSGAYPERVQLYWMLAGYWGRDHLWPRRWTQFFRAGVRLKNFDWHLKQFDQRSLDEGLVAAFGQAVEAATGPGGGNLRDELEACVADFNYLRGDPSWELATRRNALIGVLRGLVARASVEFLEPDVVVLDEFQRFKDVLQGDSFGAELAHEIFGHTRARVLLLSATPFKMYTLPDEATGEDHYEDFNATVEFLAGAGRAANVRADLRVMRDAAVAGEATDAALEAKGRVQYELRRVMSRSERLAQSPDRDGMMPDRDTGGVSLERTDVRSWVTLNEVAQSLGNLNVFEYWRSSPYPLNLMDRDSYQVHRLFNEAIERQDVGVMRALRGAAGLLDWDDFAQYRRVDPANAKLRRLSRDVFDEAQAWRLVWLPPALPYHQLSAPYDQEHSHTFTKRLVFSAWTVVPKAISVMMSYEAERRTVEYAGLEDHTYEKQRAVSPPLQYIESGTTVALLYPSVALAKAGDPLAIARERDGAGLMSREEMVTAVRRRVEALVAGLGLPTDRPGVADSRWYLVTAALLDMREGGMDLSAWVNDVRHLGEDSDGPGVRLEEHLHLLERVAAVGLDGVADLELNAVPADLVEVLTELALGSPAITGLRALSRVCGGETALSSPRARLDAYRVAQGLRSMFNKPEIIQLLRAGDDGVYWRAVLHHNIDGCLQAVLDEYVHVLTESEGLQGTAFVERSEPLADVIVEALAIRTTNNTVGDFRVKGDRVIPDEHSARSHFAARYGRVQTSDQAAVRESTVRTAYNSPFRPFVLASTSVGQEGLDFHTYSHAVVHWNLPSNPVDMEQREGRVHRYKGHAIRKNVAADFGPVAFAGADDDPWAAMFLSAEGEREPGSSEIVPFWVYAPPGGARIESYVPAMPLSRELQHYRRLKNTMVTYRLLLGQPRQEDLASMLGEDAEWMQIDLGAPTSQVWGPAKK